MRKTKSKQEVADREAVEIADKLAPLPAEEESNAEGLTTMQRTVLQLKLRNFTQSQIAKFLKVTDARVSQLVKAIREHYQSRGSDVDQATVIGESITQFEDVEKEAWKIYGELEGAKKLKALDTVMEAREKHIKLLMDVGLVKKAAVLTQTELIVPSVVRNLTPERRQEVITTILALPAGLEPTPPVEGELEED